MDETALPLLPPRRPHRNGEGEGPCGAEETRSPSWAATTLNWEHLIGLPQRKPLCLSGPVFNRKKKKVINGLYGPKREAESLAPKIIFLHGLRRTENGRGPVLEAHQEWIIIVMMICGMHNSVCG